MGAPWAPGTEWEVAEPSVLRPGLVVSATALFTQSVTRPCQTPGHTSCQEPSADRLPHMKKSTEYAVCVICYACVDILYVGVGLSSGDFLLIGILSFSTLQNKVGRKWGQLLNLVGNLRLGFS